MNNTNEPIPVNQDLQSAKAPASVALTLARTGAIVMAISIVSYLVWTAQATANPGPQQPATDAEQGGDAVPPPAGSDVLMPSSKFAPVDIFDPSNNTRAPLNHSELLLPGSKSALLPSSKSGRPMSPEMADQIQKIMDALPKQAAKIDSGKVKTDNKRVQR
jgi:hypothetical protein